MKTIKPYRDRAIKENINVRCCWVCGKIGGFGFTNALKGAGYRIKLNEIGYAHNNCMKRAMKQANNVGR